MKTQVVLCLVLMAVVLVRGNVISKFLWRCLHQFTFFFTFGYLVINNFCFNFIFGHFKSGKHYEFSSEIILLHFLVMSHS